MPARAPKILLGPPVRPGRQRLALVECACDPRCQRVDERDERSSLGDLRLRIAESRLYRGKLNMRPHPPPQLRVLGHRPRLVEEADVLLPVVPAFEPVGNAAP